ncbi:MAG: Glycosyl transferase group 1 [Parcubacteria group bacterium GW2011_GWF2_45_11]|nr:MAG: Glycosyl transferase group 1 [Parcubacteria group bacterium GW2011_GWF2_45_11]
MKVLLVTFEFPPRRGGMENYYYNLLRHQADFEGVVLTMPQPQAESFDRRQNFKIIRRPLLSSVFWPRWIKLSWLIARTVKREKIDRLWVGDVLPVGAAVWLLKKFYKIRYFVSTHGLDIMLPQKSLSKEKLMLKVLAGAEFITANSQFTKKELLNLQLPADKIAVIYPGAAVLDRPMDNSEKIFALKNKLSLSGKTVLLTVGRLVKRKGQDKVIEAMLFLLKQRPDLVYLIVGDGPEKPYFQSLIDNFKLNDRVKIVANVSNEDLPYYYQLADLFVLTARNIDGDVEGFGLVYLEAAQFGLPAVAGRIKPDSWPIPRVRRISAGRF